MENKNAYRILVGEPDEKSRLRRSRRRRDWINLAQDTDKWRDVVTMVVTPRIPYNAVKVMFFAS